MFVSQRANSELQLAAAAALGKSPETACPPHYVFGVKVAVKKCTGPLGVVYQPLTHTLLMLSFLHLICISSVEV